MYLFILGALATQLSYIVVQWLQLRYKEYLYYGAYIATFILYTLILFQEDILKIPENSATFIIIDSFKRPMAFLLYLEYFLFAQYFIDLKERFPRYDKILKPLRKIILGFIACEIILRIAGIQYSAFGNACYYLFSIFLFVVFVVFIIKLWKSEDRLIKYVLWASLSVSVGAFLSNFLVLFHLLGIADNTLSEFYFIPTILGAGFEIYFLNTGIVYKISLAEKKLIATQQQLISQLTENENLLTAQLNIRNKIAQDLHDDIGATLSGITLHSHLANEQMGNGNNESVINSLNLIRNSANEMVNNLNDVVWVVNPKNDNAEKMMERLKEYALNIAQAQNILINWQVDDNIDNVKLPMECRRNMYLICKEAINNAVKYSSCTQITVQGGLKDRQLGLSVRDNGKGFESNARGNGNGLKNMVARAEANKMDLQVSSRENSGTTISINYQITQ